MSTSFTGRLGPAWQFLPPDEADLERQNARLRRETDFIYKQQSVLRHRLQAHEDALEVYRACIVRLIDELTDAGERANAPASYMDAVHSVTSELDDIDADLRRV